MARFALSIVVLVALAPRARADEGMLPNGGQLQITDLYINLHGDPAFTKPNDADQKEYFNLAHCVCGSATAGDEQSFQLAMTVVNASGQINRPADLWLGPECDNDQTRDTNCAKVDSQAIGDLSTLQNVTVRKTLPVGGMIAPVSVSCPTTEGDGHVWVLADVSGGGTYDYSLSYGIPYDTLAPPAPANPTATGGENAVQVDWDAPTDRAEDVAYYQALCARVDNGGPAVSPPSHDPRYQTTSQLCPTLMSHEVVLTAVNNISGKRDPEAEAFGPVDAAPVDAAPSPPDAAPTNLPTGLTDLDESFICGETTGPASSMRIGGLENNVDYYIVVVAVDLSGNASGVYFQNPIMPLPVTDFWEDLHDKGSGVEGGFCLIAETYGDGGWPTTALRAFRDDTLASSAIGRWLTAAYYDVSGAIAPVIHGSIALRVIAAIVLAPVVALALLWHVLTLPGLIALLFAVRWWRRRARRRGRGPGRAPRRLVVAATLLAVVALGTTASAQPSPDPYWADGAFDDNSADELAEPHWHVGLRIGPYVPAIDAQAGGNPGPYEAMFGKGTSVMPMLDVDWLFLRRFGQLGVGGSIGAMWKSAKAYQAGTDPNDPMRPRSTGDATNFRLIPLAVTAVYRFTYLDDAYGIPVVPYVRGGLSYYIWWIGAPSGNTAVIRTPAGCMLSDPACKENRARGASIGVQGSIGLAIRAERIDPSAARSMRDGGVEHAGFYAELSLAKVDGFGDSKKLSVGDTTWFAGVDFEF